MLPATQPTPGAAALAQRASGRARVLAESLLPAAAAGRDGETEEVRLGHRFHRERTEEEDRRESSGIWSNTGLWQAGRTGAYVCA